MVTGTHCVDGLAAPASDYIWWQPLPALEPQLSSYSYLLSSSRFYSSSISSGFCGSIGNDIYGSSNNDGGGSSGCGEGDSSGSSGCYYGNLMVIFLFNHNDDNCFKLNFSDS